MTESERMSGFDSSFDFTDSVSNVPQSSTEASTNSQAIRFDPFADPVSSGLNVKSSAPQREGTKSFKDNNIRTPDKKPPLKVDPHSTLRDEGNFAIFSPANGNPKTQTLTINSITRDEVVDVGKGMVLGRVSARSLLMRDWTPFFYVIMQNKDIRYYDDPNFLKTNSPDDYSILIYREKSDYENNPMGTAIKKVIPIRPNYCCSEVKRKNYGAEYDELCYFVMEDLSEIKNIPVAKFASNNRTDMDLMWMNLKCRIAAAKKRQIESLVGI